ncbi:MAG: hypothetical protein RJQ09_16425 [Cyclobacteriaceae bacterium]
MKNTPAVLSFLFALIVLPNLFSLGTNHYDEAFYVNAIDQMFETGDWLIPKYHDGSLRVNKPILSYWIFGLGKFLFGNWLYGLRLMSLFAAVSLVFLIASFEKTIDSSVTFYLSPVILISTKIFVDLAIFAIPEMLFVVFIVWAHLEYYQLLNRKGNLTKLYILLALGFLIKGPWIAAYPFLTALGMSILDRSVRPLTILLNIKGIIIFLLLVLPWFLYITHQLGWQWLVTLFENEIIARSVESSGTWLRRLQILWELSPWVILIIPAIFAKKKDYQSKFLLVWFFGSLIFLLVIISTFHIHYTLVFTAPLALLVSKQLKSKPEISVWLMVPIIFWFIKSTLQNFIFDDFNLNVNYHYWLWMSTIPILAIIWVLLKRQKFNSVGLIILIFMWTAGNLMPRYNENPEVVVKRILENSLEGTVIASKDYNMYARSLLVKPTFKTDQNVVVTDDLQTTVPLNQIYIVEKGEFIGSELQETSIVLDSVLHYTGRNPEIKQRPVKGLYGIITGRENWYTYYFIQAKTVGS